MCSFFSVWAALGLKRAAPKVCVFSCWDKLRFRGELCMAKGGTYSLSSLSETGGDYPVPVRDGLEGLTFCRCH